MIGQRLSLEISYLFWGCLQNVLQSGQRLWRLSSHCRPSFDFQQSFPKMQSSAHTLHNCYPVQETLRLSSVKQSGHAHK